MLDNRDENNLFLGLFYQSGSFLSDSEMNECNSVSFFGTEFSQEETTTRLFALLMFLSFFLSF